MLNFKVYSCHIYLSEMVFVDHNFVCDSKKLFFYYNFRRQIVWTLIQSKLPSCSTVLPQQKGPANNKKSCWNQLCPSGGQHTLLSFLFPHSALKPYWLHISVNSSIKKHTKFHKCSSRRALKY